ncbi:MAG: hypothetical protein E7G24_11985, partial [Clostridium celatum]|nr:hypothetical protein [Clostridium celatum]
MEALFKQIVKHKKIIISIFSIAVIVCAICSKFVSVNYDMNDYLPDGCASTTSLEVMEEEFGSGIPNARVMVSDISIPKALELKDELSSIDGVQEVTWLDDAVDITKPIQTLDSKT